MDKLRYPPPGTAPATLMVPPEYQSVKPVISLCEYDAHSLFIKRLGKGAETRIEIQGRVLFHHPEMSFSPSGIDRHTRSTYWQRG